MTDEQEIPVRSLKKCEGCGTVSGADNYKHIHLTNGGLTLCLQCLAEVNGKNPEVARLRVLLKRAVDTHENSSVECFKGRDYDTGEPCPACELNKEIRSALEPRRA